MTEQTPQSGGEGRRARARRERTEQILATALGLIEREGMDGLTVAKLAKEMDWAVGALYRYYRSKDALCAALQQRMLATYREAAEGELAEAYPGGGDPLAELVFVAMHYRRYAAANTTHFEMIALSLGEPRPLLGDAEAGQVMQSGLELLGLAAQRFASAAAQGTLDGNSDPLRRTLVYWSTMQGVLLMRKLERLAPGVIDIDALYVDAISALLRGWGADAAAVAAAVEAHA